MTSEVKTYDGNCHCGAVKYRVKASENPTVFQCNCSICFKKGYKHLFQGKDDFVFIKGEDHLKDYEFAGKSMLHRVRSST